MKRICIVLFVLCLALPALGQTTWYIRTDGGNRAQCTGTTDAAFVAGGSLPEACGFNDYRLLAWDGATYSTSYQPWLVKGGDTIRIHAGQYRLGYNGPGPNDHDDLMLAGDPFNSAMPPIPSGTADNPTKIIGDGISTTQLFGGHGVGNLINLGGSSFVQISGLELTDHSQCTRVGAGYAAPVLGCVTSYPLTDDYAGVGIATDVGTHDITLSDLNIHGFTSRGIQGPLGGLVTVSNVRIAFNGGAGWDFDNGSGTPSPAAASVVASKLVVEGNGCNEEYPITNALFPAASCFDQNSAGYGDGVGTPGTPLNFTCNQCIFRYNTQDGLDLLHTSGSVVKVTNSQSYGNMGQQWKMGPMKQVIFQGNTTVHNPYRMGKPLFGNTTYFKYLSNFGRAGGDGIALDIDDNSIYTITNNSYAGYGATSYDIGCAGTCTKPVITYENNLNIGYTQPIAGGQAPGIFYYEMSYNPFVANDHNIFYNMRTCPATNGVCTDPHIADEPTDAEVTADETVLDGINFALTSASTNAKGMGIAGADIGATGVTVASGSSGAAGATGTSGSGATGSASGSGSTSGDSTPPAALPSSITINLPSLTCTLNGTQYVCK